jgi:hypothetical protein
MMKAKKIKEKLEFWLDQCPVQWFRDKVGKDYVFYAFETPNEDEEDV